MLSMGAQECAGNDGCTLGPRRQRAAGPAHACGAPARRRAAILTDNVVVRWRLQAGGPGVKVGDC
jgi:hypothetical protein